MHYFGSGTPTGETNIEWVSHGYRKRMEMVAMIAKWDMALLPYPCDPKYAETAELSFPSKSRVYAAAGLPIVSYAPVQSSVEQFFSHHYAPYYINARKWRSDRIHSELPRYLPVLVGAGVNTLIQSYSSGFLRTLKLTK